MKPTSKKESELRGRFAHPHDTWNNHDQAVRIAKRRWKRKTHKLVRKQAKGEVARLKQEVDRLRPTALERAAMKD